MISSDERQTEDILRKWLEDNVNVTLFGVFAEGGFFSMRGKLESVEGFTATVVGQGRRVALNFGGATIKYGEAKESPSEMAKNLAPDAMGFDFVLPNGDRCGLLELRGRELD